MASKARLFGDDFVLSATLATDDPREQKRFGRQVRHFDHGFWQQEYEHFVLQGNLVKFSQKYEMRLALAYTGQRRLAKANRHDKLRGTGLSACDQHASPLDNWWCLNLLGQALERAREILRQAIITPLCKPILPGTLVSMDRTSDTGFEVDPVNYIRLDTASNPAYVHMATLAAFADSVTDDYAPEVCLAHTNRVYTPIT